MVAIVYRVNTRTLEEAVARYSGVANTSLRDAFKMAMRGLMRRTMGITPPANAKSERGRGGQLTTDDKRRGERSLSDDLRVIFSTLHIRDARLEAFLTRSAGGDASPIERALGLVAANGESAEAIHARVFRKNKKPGKRIKNDRPQKYWIEESEFRRLESTLRKRVGKTASGWMQGFQVLGISAPGWVRRHGPGRSRARYQESFWRFFFECDATRVHDAMVPELTRRMGYGRSYTRNAFERQSEYLLRKNAQVFDRPGARPRL